MANKIFYTIFGILVLINENMGAVTVEQMLAAGKLMRDVCQPKFAKVPVEVLDNIKNGEIPEDKDGKCYIHCVLELMQAMKKSKFMLESSLKQVDILLPDDYKDEYRAGMKACKSSTDGIKNPCDAAYALLRCLKDNTPRFLFP